MKCLSTLLEIKTRFFTFCSLALLRNVVFLFLCQLQLSSLVQVFHLALDSIITMKLMLLEKFLLGKIYCHAHGNVITLLICLYLLICNFNRLQLFKVATAILPNTKLIWGTNSRQPYHCRCCIRILTFNGEINCKEVQLRYKR